MADVEKRFVFYGEWLNNIKSLDQATQDKVIADIVRYGTNEDMFYSDDPVVSTIVNFTKGAIDHSKDEYLKKVMAGKTNGRKKSVDDDQILKLAREGKTAGQIAELLNLSVSSVNHSEGWKRRKEPVIEQSVVEEPMVEQKKPVEFIF